MKTMTCKHLGGPCDFQLHGNTADEVIKSEDSHLKEMVASGDETHKSALKEMKGRWNHPLTGLRWYKKTKRDFAVFPKTDQRSTLPSDTTMIGRQFRSSMVAERCRLTRMQVRTLTSHGVEPQSTCVNNEQMETR